MGFTKVTELPQVLHPVERDPFLDSTCGEVRSGEPRTAPLDALALDPDELRARSRLAELAA